MSDNTLSYRHEHSISILESHIQLEIEHFDTLENKAQQYINVSTLLITILSGFFLNEIHELKWFQQLLFALLAIDSGIVILLSLIVLHPRDWRSPVDLNNWEQIESHVVGNSDEGYRKAIVEYYKDIIQTNESTLGEKRGYVDFANLAVFIQMFLFAIWIASILIG